MKKVSIILSIILLLICTLITTLPNKLEFKHLQGPPEEFKEHLIPEPKEATIAANSALIPIILRKLEGEELEYQWEGEIPVDSETSFSISVLSQLDNIEFEAILPNENQWKLFKDLPFYDEVTEQFGWGKTIKAKIYQFKEPQRGLWKIKITKKTTLSLPEQIHLYLLIENQSSFKTYSHFTSLQAKVNDEIGLITRIAHEQEQKNLKNVIADMSVTLPSGEEQIVEMHDDGLHNDLKANDGNFGATIKAKEEGNYIAQVIMRGQTNDGYMFYRTTQHFISVVDEKLELDDKAIGKIKNYPKEEEAEMMDIQLKVLKNKNSLKGKKFKAYAEIWGEKEPIAWIGGMVIGEEEEKDNIYFTLKLSLKWISKTKIYPTTLKNVYIQDVKHSIPLVTKESITLEIEENPQQFSSFVQKFPFNGIITESMKFGIRPKKYKREKGEINNDEGKVILVHGYCSAGNPFPTEHFMNYLAFEDPNQNRDVDTFAGMLWDFIEPHKKEGVSFIGHSQGGMASLHLYSFYWSSADKYQANGPEKRILQSVGTPYQGCTLADNIAKLGEILGIGCGKNSDLTPSGAKLWLATIPKEAREKVYYHTTQYKDWRWCSLPANAILKWPNDGTAEKTYSKLADGHHIHHKKGWCHTSNMKYDAQCTDASRNKEMNEKAAR